MKIALLAIPALLVLGTPAVAQVMTAQEYLTTAGASDLYERTASQTVLDPASSPAPSGWLSAQEYLTTAGASDLYERTASQTVLETTQDPKVREFAAMMVDTHSKSTARVKAAALKAKLKVVPPQLTPTQQEMIAQLQAEKGPARDAAYVAQQKAAHGQALSVQKAYAAGGKAPSLRTAAAAIVPVVEHHIMLLKAM